MLFFHSQSQEASSKPSHTNNSSLGVQQRSANNLANLGRSSYHHQQQQEPANNSPSSQRRVLSSTGSALNNIIQQYGTNSSNNNTSETTSNAHNYEQRAANNNHHQSNRLSIGDYYYAAAHSLMNPSGTSSSNPANLPDPYTNPTSATASQPPPPTSNNLPTSNSSISGPINQNEYVSALNTPSSTSITNNTLARVFSLIVKLIRELLNTVYTEKRSLLAQLNSKVAGGAKQSSGRAERQHNQRVVSQSVRLLVEEVNKKLDSPWHWLISLMDATEAQLRFGASLSASDFGHSTNALQYLRHLEERALLTNYFNNNYGN